MKDALTLSEEQVTKIQALVKESHAQAKASTTTDPKIKKTEEKDRLKALEVSIIGVLTAEQAKKYEQWKIEQKAELKSKRQEKKEQK
ncbi:MAG: hypothetical protein HYZ42_04850 [Bacteroidetes bacterium]|nr:hypothetical protein [Bacteroidota bacterium]